MWIFYMCRSPSIQGIFLDNWTHSKMYCNFSFVWWYVCFGGIFYQCLIKKAVCVSSTCNPQEPVHTWATWHRNRGSVAVAEHWPTTTHLSPWAFLITFWSNYCMEGNRHFRGLDIRECVVQATLSILCSGCSPDNSWGVVVFVVHLFHFFRDFFPKRKFSLEFPGKAN